MKTFLGATAALCFLTSLSAQADCLADKILVSDISFVSASDEYLTVSYSLFNGLDFAIAGVYVRIIATYPDRPSPIADQPMQRGMQIRGGLLPGETVDFTDILVTGAHASEFIKDGSRLEFAYTVENIADKDMVSYYEGSLVGGWSPGPSPFRCE